MDIKITGTTPEQQKQNDAVIEEAKRLYEAGVGGRIVIKTSLEFRDKDGNVVKVIDVVGGVPFSQVKDI